MRRKQEPRGGSRQRDRNALSGPAAMAVEGGMKCVKFLLYVLLLAFCACAVGLIAIGVAVQVVLKQAITHETTAGSLLPVVIIAVGAFLFLVAFVGCCGACKENYCLMITFAVFLSLIMLVEVAVAIAGYVFRDQVKSEFNKSFRQQMENYLKDNKTATILDKLQKENNCCGASNYTDWESIPGMGKDRVPDSCCVNITAGCGNNFKESTIHTQGCLETITTWLRKNVLLVAAAALGIAFVEVLGVIFSCCLVKSIRSGYEVM
ncbi:CD63 antigen isoform X1 [Arvicanthis niloticus]|uniref:CD63 antigen isoform X1 n=2 Tax=Arvicanthis niloticus TaxID=61156 RepID=UPI0014871FC5|nr:CD63 antigen isoform X1 [Arvicanthis niloticus]